MNARETQQKKQRPLILWVALWIGSFFLLGTLSDLINSISLLGFLSSQIDMVIVTLYFSLFIVPISIAVWFVMKFILRCFNKSYFLEGNEASNNIFLIWFALVFLFFAYGFYKDLTSPRIKFSGFGLSPP